MNSTLLAAGVIAAAGAAVAVSGDGSAASGGSTSDVNRGGESEPPDGTWLFRDPSGGHYGIDTDGDDRSDVEDGTTYGVITDQ